MVVGSSLSNPMAFTWVGSGTTLCLELSEGPSLHAPCFTEDSAEPREVLRAAATVVLCMASDASSDSELALASLPRLGTQSLSLTSRCSFAPHARPSRQHPQTLKPLGLTGLKLYKLVFPRCREAGAPMVISPASSRPSHSWPRRLAELTTEAKIPRRIGFMWSGL